MRFSFLVVLFLPFALGAQSVSHYEWQKDRKRYVLSEKEKGYTEYLLKYHRQFNYEWEKDDLIIYHTEHRITYVTNPESIQRHNRISISLQNVIDLVDLKARTINRDGKVVTFDQTNLKEVKDEQAGKGSKIFAMEGVEEGSELEFFYTVKMKLKVFETPYLQFELPVKQISLQLTSPKKLIFEMRVYNDTSRAVSDTIPGHNRLTLVLNDVRALTEEKFSYYNTNRKRAEIKLAYNNVRTRRRLNTWADAAIQNYEMLLTIDKKDEKSLDKFMQNLQDDKTWPLARRVHNVENKIKQSIHIQEESSASAYSALADVLKYSQAGSAGITRLLALSFERLGIDYRIVLTCDREDSKFDPQFDTWNFLDDYLIYIPELKSFIAPGDNFLRFPLVPSKYTANKGLFIEPVVVGSIHAGIASIQDIPELPYTADRNDMNIDVAFNDDLETNTITETQTFIGVQAAYLTGYYKSMTEQERNKLAEGLFRSTVPDITIPKWKVTLTEVGDLPRFDIEARFETRQFIETAGNKILFKAGELIGPQSELYRDDSRVTDVENSQNRGYDRLIRVTLPKGYKLVNPETLKMKVIYHDTPTDPFAFISDYTIADNVLTITITEYYKSIYAPLARYEDFRKVVNASADFNKVILVLEKL